MKYRERWTANRKKAVLAEIAAGRLTDAEAIILHGLTKEELAEWRTGGVLLTKTPKALVRHRKPRRHSYAISRKSGPPIPSRTEIPIAADD